MKRGDPARAADPAAADGPAARHRPAPADDPTWTGDPTLTGDRARVRLAAAQAALARSLLAGAPAPTGFDEHRIAVEARSLLHKRARVAELLRPDVAAEIGDRWRSLFQEYAHRNPRTVGVTWRQDAEAFTRWLTDHGHLAPRPARRRRWPFRR